MNTIKNPTSTTRTDPITEAFTKPYGWVLVSIEEMIEESLYFCETFAHTLNVHNNHPAAAVFEWAKRNFQTEKQWLVDEIERYLALQNLPLPKRSPWEKPYAGYQHPATTLMEAGYLMTESEAELIITKIVKVHQDFYDYLSQTQSNEASLKLVFLLQTHCKHCTKTP